MSGVELYAFGEEKVREMSLFQGLNYMRLGKKRLEMCPYFRG